ncbi:protein of unknown function DUF1568 [Candidatus Koribacter versatilis Ellin345]|uniref:Transposase IS200-like domain-containing protein n=2 Tax=Candidatus Korobacter versatilis TaxID=658062 RepID=Q1IKX2_KORVE|nr:protein of unknown function DUF1568 [Candidatus Koribacter versatilis Ellin345]
MPWGLKRYQHTGQSHFITFSCYHRLPYLSSTSAKQQFELSLEDTRVRYGMPVAGYVVMPEHVHLLVWEPQRSNLATALQSIKQSVSRLLIGGREHFWQKRYYDFNVRAADKFWEKLHYLHQNPVKRGLVKSPEQWTWSSFRHHAFGEIGTVELESHWTALRRERAGIRFELKKDRDATTFGDPGSTKI